MGNVSSVNDNPFADIGLRSAPRSEAQDNELGQDEFLQLLTTQLQAQDPLNPQSNGEFIAQLASFSTADGVQELLGAFDNFSNQITSGQALQASSLVGRTVLLPTNLAAQDRVFGGIGGQINIPVGTQNVTLDISNEQGEFIRRVELGDQLAGGLTEFLWDGLDEEGERASFEDSYVIEATGIVGAGDREALPVAVDIRVHSVTLNQNSGQGVRLNLEGGQGQARLTDVLRVGPQIQL